MLSTRVVDEYIRVISLSAAVPVGLITDELWNITSAFYLYSMTVRAEVTHNTSTSESPTVTGYANSKIRT